MTAPGSDTGDDDGPRAGEAIITLARAIGKLLAGQPAPVQGAALADLLATWLAGHRAADAAATAALREALLKMHMQTVRKMIPVNARIIHHERRAGHG